jgi:hypothetical protein
MNYLRKLSAVLIVALALTPSLSSAQTAAVSSAAAVGAPRLALTVDRADALRAHPEEVFHIVCRDRFGAIVWTRDAHNMLTTAGANKYLDSTIKTGVSSPTWFVSLLYGASAPTFAITDTLASNGWSPSAEVTGTQVTNATRPAFTPGTIAAGSVNDSASPAVFTGNATVTLQGIIVANSATLDETASTLLGEATFTPAPIASGYTINVTVTISVTAG